MVSLFSIPLPFFPRVSVFFYFIVQVPGLLLSSVEGGLAYDGWLLTEENQDYFVVNVIWGECLWCGGLLFILLGQKPTTSPVFKNIILLIFCTCI